jgi:hypothetical protein
VENVKGLLASVKASLSVSKPKLVGDEEDDDKI